MLFQGAGRPWIKASLFVESGNADKVNLEALVGREQVIVGKMDPHVSN